MREELRAWAARGNPWAMGTLGAALFNRDFGDPQEGLGLLIGALRRREVAAAYDLGLIYGHRELPPELTFTFHENASRLGLHDLELSAALLLIATSEPMPSREGRAEKGLESLRRALVVVPPSPEVAWQQVGEAFRERSPRRAGPGRR